MLLFNGEIVDLSSSGKWAKHFNEAWKAIETKKLRFPLVLRYSDDHRIADLEDPSKFEESTGVSFRFEQPYRNGDFTGTCIYYKATTPDRRNPGGPQLYKPRWGVFKGMEVLQQEDKEYIIWMLFVNPHMATIPELAKYQNQDRRRTHIIFENKVKEAEAIARRRGLIAQVDIMLQGGEGGLEESMMRDIAMAYNIPMASDEKFTSFEIANLLRKKVVVYENNKLKTKIITQFLEDSKFGPRMKAKKNIQMAIDQELIALFMETQSTSYWYFIEKDDSSGQEIKKEGQRICEIPANRRTATHAFNYLVNYYVNNEKEYESMVALIE